MYQDQPPRRSGGSRAGGVIFFIVAVIAVLAWIGAHAAQQATITTCTGAGTAFASCSQQTVPVQTQAP